MIKGDASEILALAVGLQQAGVRAGAAIREPVLAAGEMIATVWRTGARMSSGAHGIHYPDSIEADMVFDLGGASVEVGPNPGMPQGGMSFEHGSRNQPPHLDGSRAVDELGPAIERRIDSAVGFLLP